VLFPDGTPARRAQVLATLVEDGGRPHRSAHEPTMPGGRVVSDERGRFRFALLKPGVYSLHVGNPYTVSRLLALPPMSARTFATPARDVQLEAGHVALCVRVVDRQGRALQGAGVELRRLRPDAEVGEEGAPGELRLADRSFARTAGADPLALLALDPGDRALLSATLPSCHPVQTLVTAADRPGEQRLTLHVFSLADAARVVPRVVDRTGAGVQDYRVDVFDPYSRLLVRTQLAPDAEGALPAIAPGTWLLQARSPHAGAHTSGPLPGGLGALVALRPDGLQRVELLLE
jgi:hypothetical protein